MSDEVKKGDYIYKITYPFGKRELEKHKIKKVSEKSFRLFYGNWLIKKDLIGNTWFTSLIDAYKRVLERHENYLRNREEELEPIRKEIRYLKRRLKELKL